MCEELGEVGGEQAVAVQEIERYEAKAIGAANRFFVEGADEGFGERFWFSAVFVKAGRKRLPLSE